MKHSLPLLALTLFVLLIAPATVAPLTVAAQTAAPTQAAPTQPAANASPAATAEAEKTIAVKVALESGKAGQKLPADMNLADAVVTLYAVKDQGPVYKRDGRTDSAGTAKFASLPYQEGYGFGAIVRVGLTAYISQLTKPAAGSSQVNVSVPVFPVTTDAGKLRVSAAYVLAEALSAGKLQLTNLYMLSNDGNKTVEGGLKDPEGKTASLSFPLPAGAEDVKFDYDDGTNFVQVDGGFLVRPGVQPGEETTQVAVRYSVPYSNSVRIENALAYPTDKLTVFVATQGITLTSSLMKGLAPQQRGDGVTMHVWGAEKLPANETISFELSGKPVEPPPPLPVTQAKPASAAGLQGFVSARKPVELAGMGLIAVGLLLAVFAAGWWLYRARFAGRFAHDPTEREARALVAALADLQEDHEAGRVELEDYEQRRLLLTEALASLLATAPLAPTPLTGPEAS